MRRDACFALLESLISVESLSGQMDQTVRSETRGDPDSLCRRQTGCRRRQFQVPPTEMTHWDKVLISERPSNCKYNAGWTAPVRCVMCMRVTIGHNCKLSPDLCRTWNAGRAGACLIVPRRASIAASDQFLNRFCLSEEEEPILAFQVHDAQRSRYALLHEGSCNSAV